MTRQQWLILRTIAGGLVLAVLLLLAAAAGAQTWPRDVTGTPAAECSALDALGTPQLCGPLNPLPVVTSGALSGSSGPTVGSQNWFLSQPPGFNPFVWLDGTTQTGTVVCPAFLDDVNIICFQGGVPGGPFTTFRSSNAGLSFQALSLSQSLGGNGRIQSAVRLADGRYVISRGAPPDAVIFAITSDGLAFVTSTCTGCAFLIAEPESLTLNGSTILASARAAPGFAAGTFTLCRSTNTGATFTCASGVAIAGYTGTNEATWVRGNTMIAAPSAGVWLALVERFGADNALKIIRSTDDGVTWTEVMTDAANPSPPRGIGCLTSTLCLVAAGQRIYRSTNGGLTWTTIVTSAPDGANTNWEGVAVFDALTAVAVPFLAGAPVNAPPAFYRTIDGGLTWLTIRGRPSGCPQSTGAATSQGAATIITRNGRGLAISRYTALLAGTTPCAFYATSGTGGTSVTGPLGTAWNIGADGSGPISQGDPLRPVTVAPVQGVNLFNSQTTGAADTAVVTTLTGVRDQRVHVYRVEASCSAGTSQLTIVDGSIPSTVWSTLTGEVGATRFRQSFTPASLTGGTSVAVTITLAACGAGNTGTLIVHADRY